MTGTATGTHSGSKLPDQLPLLITPGARGCNQKWELEVGGDNGGGAAITKARDKREKLV